MPNDLIVLATHGAPPRDFPARELAEFFALHARLEQSSPDELPPAMRDRAQQMERRVREWPRTAENDPFWASSHALAAKLHELTGCPVLVGFNEFCAPDLEAVCHAAAAEGPERVVVVTPMLTPGGGHAEVDIPAAIAHVQAAHPDVPFVYAWPYETADVAEFLARHISRRVR